MTGFLSEKLALRCGYSSNMAERIKIAAKLHDVGKYRIPANILKKQDKLTDSEFNTLKLHTVYGFIALKDMRGNGAEMARQTALYHHERIDKKGYWGLDGSKLPEYIKIITLADVTSALISKREYKQAWPLEKVDVYIQSNAGSQFDPRLVELFTPIVQEVSHLLNGKKG